MSPLRQRAGFAVLPGIAALAVAGFLVGALSCAPLRPPSEPGPERALEPPRAGDLVLNLGERIDRFRSLRGLAKFYYWDREERGVFQGTLLVRRPDRLRLEALSPLGVVLVVTADEDEVVGFHPREGLFYRGRSSKENLVRYTRIPLGLDDVTSLLMGLPPVRMQGPWQAEDSAVQWRRKGSGGEGVTFDPRIGVPIGWERLGPEGEVRMSAVFSDFSATPAGLFPLRIAVEFYDHEERRFEIRYEEPELNVALPSSLFVQQRPDHVREVPLESLGG